MMRKKYYAARSSLRSPWRSKPTELAASSHPKGGEKTLFPEIVVKDEDASMPSSTIAKQPPRRRRPPRRIPKKDIPQARFVETPEGLNCCSKCDGAHDDANCPWYKKPRVKHVDSRLDKPSQKKSSSPYILKRARIVPQPPDGSCLFHSLACGMGKRSARDIRREVASFIRQNPNLQIAETPLKDWIRWETRASVRAYTSRMAQHGQWGGAVEMAAAAQLYSVSIEVYEPLRNNCNSFKRISRFGSGERRKYDHTIRVLYRGGVHYDALLEY